MKGFLLGSTGRKRPSVARLFFLWRTIAKWEQLSSYPFILRSLFVSFNYVLSCQLPVFNYRHCLSPHFFPFLCGHNNSSWINVCLTFLLLWKPFFALEYLFPEIKHCYKTQLERKENAKVKEKQYEKSAADYSWKQVATC